MFIEQFIKYCNEKGVSPSRAGTDIGVSRSTVTGWIKNGAAPRAQHLYKLAEYFGCTVDDLLTEKSDLELEDSIEIAQDIIDLYNSLSDDKKRQAAAFLRFLEAEDTPAG